MITTVRMARGMAVACAGGASTTVAVVAGEGHRARIVSGNAPYQRRESDEFIRDAGRPQIERDFRIGAAHSGVTLVLPALSRKTCARA